ncbi:MAG: LysE family translocator [Rhizobiales bacterium]|nr:LysE family translocator [Hyphomicrobiales bacterium]
MELETWIAYAVANIVLTLIPGPSVLLVVSQAITRGVKAAFICIIGDVIAGVVLTILSIVGVGAILAASVTLFMIVKWAGVAYMAYLGYCQIRDARNGDAIVVENTASKSAFNSLSAGFFSAILNPKAIIFYMAFLAQFMTPDGDMVLQFTILVLTSSIVIAVILGGYALIAGRAKKAFQSPKAKKIFGYSGGGFMIGGSVLMASTR